LPRQKKEKKAMQRSVLKLKKDKAKKNTYWRLRIIFASTCFFIVTAAFAQTGTIKGFMIDSFTSEPLIGATIMVENTSFGAAADLDGNFIINNIPAGSYTLRTSYIGYMPILKTDVHVEAQKETELKLFLNANNLALQDVVVRARANRASETVLIQEQKQSLVATQSVSANELSRKGIGDAQAAVAQVSGISQQEGAKNVFVRGLGDRYNATLLNGFPIPSEEPEHKNISLDFFGTDIIQNIRVSKVFNASNYADAGGAVLDISSKEWTENQALNVHVSGGAHVSVFGQDFWHQSGSNYWGVAHTQRPENTQFNFSNSLDPSKTRLPMNHSLGISGGKLVKIGKNGNPFSFFAVASHRSDFSFTQEIIRNANTAGTVWQDQKGKKYTQNTSQLALANLSYAIKRKYFLQYNFMLIHDNNQYVGEYSGYNSERYQDSPDYIGFLRRQQTNDNLLLVNQLSAAWELSKKIKLDAGIAYNAVKGAEPDRRENNFSKQIVEQMQDLYIFTGSNRQKRFFSTLQENDINVKTALTYRLNNRSKNNWLKVGYTGRLTSGKFEAIEYNYSAVSGFFDIENLKLADLYNQENLANNRFKMTIGDPNTYRIAKFIHSAFAEAACQWGKFTGNIGLRMDKTEMHIDYKVQNVAPGTATIDKYDYLPSLNLRYDVHPKHAIRLGASKTYTLPQSKEISPYQYVNISFTSQGNPNLKPSDNYNLDLKWDFYISSGELLSLTGFYKYIQNPIGRVDEGNSAGLLTYNNISRQASAGGIEMELRKNIFNRINEKTEQINRLSAGLNASYIYTNLQLNILNTEAANSRLEGASPFLANADVSYSFRKKDKNLTAALVLNYCSRRIYTIGTNGFKDIMEAGIFTLNFTASYQFNKHFSLTVKALNVSNAAHRRTRETLSGEKITLNEFRKGQNISVGVGYRF
jgi:outer membrane receptor protein involved in Fe transport